MPPIQHLFGTRPHEQRIEHTHYGAHPTLVNGHGKVLQLRRNLLEAHPFASAKTTAALIEHLKAITDWVPKHVSGGRFTILRMDFGSEAARQMHGDDFIVQVFKEYMTKHPYFYFIPIAPHANAPNKA